MIRFANPRSTFYGFRSFLRIVFGYDEFKGGYMSPVKVKVFNYCTQTINVDNEIQINEWLAENPNIDIVQMLQSESMVTVKDTQIERNLTISIFYRESAAV